MDSLGLALAAADAALSKKGERVRVLRMREVSGVCDYFVIASADSDAQARAIADAVEERLLDEDSKVWHREGEDACRWVLLDYVDVVVHVFRRDARGFYDLDSMWTDAPEVPLREDVAVR